MHHRQRRTFAEGKGSEEWGRSEVGATAKGHIEDGIEGKAEEEDDVGTGRRAEADGDDLKCICGASGGDWDGLELDTSSFSRL